MSAGAEANKILTTNASGVATWQEAGGGWDGVLPNYTTPQRNDLFLTDGLIVYNTTENAVQIYVSDVWRNVGAKLSLAVTCSLDGDCDSTHCVDGYCCDTGCTGICDHCNVAGSIGTCTDVNSDCTGNCDICSSGNCAASVVLCTGDCDQCIGSGITYNCAADVTLCTAQCQRTCSGSDTSYNCAASSNTLWGAGTDGCTGSATRCYSGSCITCGGWVNAGYCWYNGARLETCISVCTSRGGIYGGSCDWVNDPSDYSTCLHWYGSGSSAGAQGSGPAFDAGQNKCHYHAAGIDECGLTNYNTHRQCACEK